MQRLNDSEEHPPYLIAHRLGLAKLLNIAESQFPGYGQLRLQFKT
jgi:hypothetical protein